MIELKTHRRHKVSRTQAVELRIRVRTNAPDAWIGLRSVDFRRRLVTTGSMARATIHDVLGRQTTKGLNAAWAEMGRWKALNEVWTKRPRNRLRHLVDLLDPLIAQERLEVEIRSNAKSWISLRQAAEDPLLVL